MIEKLQIGTDCLVLEKLQAEWLKVRCGDKEGYASASLMGAEKPSVEALRAQARDPKLTLAQREESALRAATLSPEDVELQKELGQLFFEKNFDFTARLKKPTMKRAFSCSCGWKDVLTCLRGCSSSDLKDVTVRAETKKDLFVVTFANAENVFVYRGKYKLNKKTEILSGEVLEQVSFSVSPVMEKSIFLGIDKARDDKWDLPVGQFVLDNASQALLNGLPKEWGLMKPDEWGNLLMQWNDCWKRPYLLRFMPDIHGRWNILLEDVGAEAPAVYWISSVEKRDNALELVYEGRYGGTTRQLFKLPMSEEEIAYLGDTAYSSNIRRHPEKHHPCAQGGP
ncbi:SH3 domain-containing protein [Archangium minus]|uniref:SH3 domain-containing protein n=1 Tax=Archangium minus TaxID=83450 RepID=A0ABY9WUT6_9BACT|nr:SH3 domain-containing protein [Archangium minus]